MTEKEVVLISKYKYPEADAGALRQHAFAKMFRNLGYRVTVVGLGNPTGKKTAVYDGIEYISLRYRGNSFFAKAASYYFFRRNLMSFLRKRIPSVVWVNDIGERSFVYVKEKAMKDNAVFIYDAVEWYSPEQFAKGENDSTYIAKNRLNTELVDSNTRVIAISRFLERYFSEKGCRTVRIPVVLDVKNKSVEKECPSEQKLTLLYAGRPTAKDNLDVICKGIAMLSDEERKRIKFVIRGVTYEKLLENCGVSEEIYQIIKDSVDIKGYVPRSEIDAEMRKADLTVLMRPDNARFAQAGFPTKVAESMMNSTPVICNLTSDLEMYLKNEENSVIVDENLPEAFARALRKALEISTEDMFNMRIAARKTAEEYFDYRSYTAVLSRLL